jgi:hypothetical protein
MNKYRAKKTEIDGIVFDSKAEARRYCELKMLEKVGEIAFLELQPKFELQKSYSHPKTGRKVRAINYTADFRYHELASNLVVVEDVKGVKTQQFILRKKMLEFKYPDIELRIIS